VVDTPTGDLVIGKGRDGRLDRWDARTGEPIGPPPGLAPPFTNRPMTAIVRSPDGSHLIVATADGSVAVLDPHTGAQRDTYAAPGVVLLGAVRVEGSRRVFCTADDGAVSCYDLDRRAWLVTGKQLSTGDAVPYDTRLVDIAGEPRVLRVVQHGDGSQEVGVWDANLNRVRSFPLPTAADSEFNCVAAGVVDRTTVVVAMGGGSAVRVWDYRTGNVLTDGSVDDGHRMASHYASIETICGLDLVVSGGYAGALSLWNLTGTVDRVVDIGYSTSGWQTIPGTGSLIVGGAMGILRLDLTRDWLLGADSN
jgi:WD40 repeat protein